MSRRSPRIRVRFSATVEIAGIAHTLVCHTRDISSDGCFLDTSEAVGEGVEVNLALMDNLAGEAVEVRGVVRRVLDGSDGGKLGIGVQLIDPPDEWVTMAERYREGVAEDHSGVRLRILVVGEETRKRGALALYVTSGWDVRFATELDDARDCLYGMDLHGVVAEFDLDSNKWAEVLATARMISPSTRRIVRTSLDKDGAPQPSGPDPLVHRFVDASSGLDALVDALSSDFGTSSNTPST
jgi:hypothetical protein